MKEERQAEEAARKATEDEARRKRRADSSLIFTGPLNKTRRKGDLEDIAAALALPVGGKKDDLLDKISKHFDKYPDLRPAQDSKGSSIHALENAPVSDVLVAGPSTVQEPALPPHTFPALSHSSHFIFEPTTHHDS